MRLSVQAGDPGNLPYLAGIAARPRDAKGWVRVFLRDAEVADVLTADEEAGTVERLVKDDAGNFIVDGSTARTEVLRGVVRIELPSWWPKGGA